MGGGGGSPISVMSEASSRTHSATLAFLAKPTNVNVCEIANQASMTNFKVPLARRKKGADSFSRTHGTAPARPRKYINWPKEHIAPSLEVRRRDGKKAFKDYWTALKMDVPSRQTVNSWLNRSLEAVRDREVCIYVPVRVRGRPPRVNAMFEDLIMKRLELYLSKGAAITIRLVGYVLRYFPIV